METKNLIKQEEGEDGKKKLVLDLDQLERQHLEIAILRDGQSGNSVELQSTKFDSRELLNFAAEGLNFIKNNRANKKPNWVG